MLPDYFEVVYVEDFVHASTAIGLGLLKRLLPKNCMTDVGDILQTALPSEKITCTIPPSKHFLKKLLWIN